jgi:N-acetylglucosamine-6-phosphate deacetylase
LKAYTAEKILIDDQWQDNYAVLVDHGKIQQLCPLNACPSDYQLIDLGSGYLAPGLFDIQVNGGGGILINDAPNMDTLIAVASTHKAFGVTSILPTLITDSFDKMQAMANAVSQARQHGYRGIRGVHFEGPFISTERKGIHNANHIRPEENQFLDLLDNHELGAVLVTLAPEKISDSFLVELIDRKVIVSAGHTDCTYEQAMNTISKGITGFTHLFNAMPPMLSRAPGPVGAAFTEKATFASVIADGHHVHAASLKTAYSALTDTRMMLISDAMPTVGSQLTQFKLGIKDIYLNDGRLQSENGTLAGAAISLQNAVQYCVETLGFNLNSACKMGSQTPARFMGLDKTIGTLQSGADAEFVLLKPLGEIKEVISDY